jgi:hypothetical protein
MRRVLGTDFDNTIIAYDRALAGIARERGFLEAASAGVKRAIRDRIRQLPDGEIEWQKCQALLYGSRIAEGELVEDVRRFFQLAAAEGITIYVISHKTEFSQHDPTRTNLRFAALEWMTGKGFFKADGLGLSPENVFFAGTRQEKIAHIRRLSCTHFIDDLEETFLEDTFPLGTERILYERERRAPPPPGVLLMRTWREICDYFFGAN